MLLERIGTRRHFDSGHINPSALSISDVTQERI